ncbi:hypothetical protein D9756_004255 [Leucocoprinus leucothites]|uniref:ferroxidase n=1 Tax=Leucocoprinus leucothites TaxID=201217 RepID=A0A8H5G0Z9_9AGAR|nr:hypothetical protein D9756_004255 [Leucoagaricus leucothites]
MFSSAVRQAARRSLLLSASNLSRRCLRSIIHTQVTVPVIAQRHQRWYATPPPQVNESDLPMERYHVLSESTLDSLLESLEGILDGIADSNYEVEYHSGVLTLRLADSGTYVINKQPPNKQIWLSSPFSGPKRYDYSETADDWLYSRDGRAMGELLNEELSEVFGRKIDLELTKVSKLLP